MQLENLQFEQDRYVCRKKPKNMGGGRPREDGVTPMLSQFQVETADLPLAPINSSLYRW